MTREPVLPSCEILTIGTELLLGRIPDTNSAFLARRLARIGVRVRFRTAVGDRALDMEETLERALERCDLVLVTGGLGPTRDDLTRETVANLAGVELVFREDLMAQIEALFRKIGYRMPENNRRQAYVPEGSLAVPNPVGTAPGFVTEIRGTPVVCLPGVPRELAHLMETWGIPWIRERFGLEDSRILTRVLHVVGMGESKVDALLGDLMGEGRNPEVALLASEGEIQVQVTAHGPDREDAVAALEREVRRRLGRKIYAADDETLEGAIRDLMQGRGLSLAVVETFTAGRLALRLHDLGDDVLRGSLVLPDRESVVRWLGTEPPPDMEGSARRLALAMRDRSGAGLGLAVVGSTGGGDGGDAMQGVVVLEGSGMSRSFAWEAGGPPGMLRRRGAVIGLNTLRIALLESNGP
ncbi:MAG: CinA family nicotinamide mononucleotide deamidase-related protein [Deltaproteobacteria bacterium]|nr:CinA family nicotinamide mononucleotide deamidase-related protein [Deltaproteobacteria bacterium]